MEKSCCMFGMYIVEYKAFFITFNNLHASMCDDVTNVIKKMGNYFTFNAAI